MPKHTINFPAESGENDARNSAGVDLLDTGEDVSAAVLNRPLDVLRRRTEILRTEVESLKYVTDSDRSLIMECPGAITVTRNASATPDTFSFSIPSADAIKILSALGPGASTVPAHVDLPGADGSSTYLRIRATSALRSYGLYNDTTEHTSSNNYTCTVSRGLDGSGVVVSFEDTWPKQHILITVAAGTSLSAVKTAVDAKILAETWPFEAVLLDDVAATPDGGDEIFVAATPARVYFSGGAEPEAHHIPSSALVSFFSNAENWLRDRDTLAIWYENVNAPEGHGGRRNSIPGLLDTEPEVTANLTNLRVHPERIPYAIPVCMRVGDFLVFLDGTRIRHTSSYTLGESLVRDGGAIQGDLSTDGGITAKQDLLVKETATVQTTDPAKVPLTVKAPSDNTANITEWRVGSGTDPVAYLENDGDLRSKALDSVLSTQDLSLGTKAVSKSVVVSRTGANTSVQGSLTVAESATLAAKLDTDVPVTITGKNDQTNDLTVWNRGSTVVAHVDETGQVFAPSLDVVATAADQVLRIGTSNADSITVGASGIEVTVPGPLNTPAGANTLSLNVGADPDAPTMTVSQTGDVNAQTGTFTRLTTNTAGNFKSLYVQGGAFATTEPTGTFLGRAAATDVLQVTGAPSQTGALQKWSVGTETSARAYIDGTGKLVGTRHAELSAPASASAPTLAVSTATSTKEALTLQAAAGQTAPLQSWLTSAGATGIAAYSDGRVLANTFDTLTGTGADTTLEVGTTNATEIKIGKGGIETIVPGTLTVLNAASVTNLTVKTISDTVPVVVWRTATSTKSLQEWHNVSGNPIAQVTSDGTFQTSAKLLADTLDTASALSATLYVGPLNATAIQLGSATTAVSVKGALDVSGASTLNSTLAVVSSTDAQAVVSVKRTGTSTKNLQEWQNSGGTAVASVAPNGSITTSETLTAKNATFVNALPILSGGTGTTTAPTVGGIIYAQNATQYASLAGTVGQVLLSGAPNNPPSWAAQSTLSVGSATTASGLAAGGNTGQVYTSNGNNSPPGWKDVTIPASLSLTSLSVTNPIAGSVSGSSASCTGNAATATTATTAGSCTGNAATATTAGSCTGNAATATGPLYYSFAASASVVEGFSAAAGTDISPSVTQKITRGSLTISDTGLVTFPDINKAYVVRANLHFNVKDAYSTYPAGFKLTCGPASSESVGYQTGGNAAYDANRAYCVPFLFVVDPTATTHQLYLRVLPPNTEAAGSHRITIRYRFEIEVQGIG